jgi:hypothetical protein
MIDSETIRHPAFDRPEICSRLFYPRRETGPFHIGAGFRRLSIPVERDVVVGGRFHEAGKEAPTLLFFHGNGEIAADYDDLAAVYRGMGINFLPVDYRGYGLSTGMPSVTSMMRDAHRILEYVRSWLGEAGFTGPLAVMGRSLGSAPALEAARHNEGMVRGLIIESGFARILPLLALLGIDDPELSEEEGPRNLEKIREVRMPTLIIHAEYDRIIPFAEGEDLFRSAGAERKTFLEIPGADHNDLFFRGRKAYLDAIGKFMQMLVSSR